jgi:hypothetical protein
MASAFLIAQGPIADVYPRLFSLPKTAELHRIFSARSSDFRPIPVRPSPGDRLIEACVRPSAIQLDGYQWHQEGNVVTITFESLVAVTEDSIQITGNEITSPTDFISGTFFGTVLDTRVAIDSNNVTIQLHTDSPWPVLIVG